ncbi:MAG: S-layer homology domain-containing protein, partial [Firmicutes bacterium]|nr:S-layer homology domain-containing protein [Bacillota bacterium]
MKKVLSLVLVLALVLGSFSMAFAAETKTTNMSDVAGNANEGAIVVANDLGIVTGYNDGTFKPANAVTRAEFAAMMTRALAIPESALKGFKTSSFKDVASDHWAVAYLGYCNSKGIMTGYEDGTARPNQTITVNEAMTMICRALGYTNQAKELVGSWPANYIALAQQLSLYDDVAATGVTDRATAAQIVYNALTVP